mmetsp:Transcript_44836/g.74422  ORF Transcript_44836/g.74422 Transcript_44836/m.74422 type:complete len:82 (+) Transcript_44836:144-389(+)
MNMSPTVQATYLRIACYDVRVQGATKQFTLPMSLSPARLIVSARENFRAASRENNAKKIEQIPEPPAVGLVQVQLQVQLHP